MSQVRTDPAYPEAFDPFGKRPRPNPPWRPMSEFDPTKPAILHDELNDQAFEWSGAREQFSHWQKYAKWHTESVITWCGHLFDRWREDTNH